MTRKAAATKTKSLSVERRLIAENPEIDAGMLCDALNDILDQFPDMAF